MAGALMLASALTGCGVSQTATGGGAGTTAASAGSSGLVFKGAYTANTPYGPNDVVSYQGSAFVGLKINMNVPPSGNSASAADWALLVAAGQNGVAGPAGPVGATGSAGVAGARGPAGLSGPAGPAGIAGPAGPIGAQGAQGPRGSQGDAGPAGVQGPSGPQGLTGSAGPMGPVGATGPAGPAGSAGPAQTVTALSGRGLGVLGDSISAANMWQPIVVARTGAVIAFQDARPGRHFYEAFECYGSPTPGSAPGTYQPGGSGNCGNVGDVATPGSTLAQNLATTDMLLLRLGTNDEVYPLGVMGDAANAGTLYGYLRWVVETLLTAKPTLRIVLITPELNHFGSTQAIQNVVDAEIAYGNSMGLPVLDLYRTSGNNAITNSVYTYDGTHPTNWAYQNVDGPLIAQFILNRF